MNISDKGKIDRFQNLAENKNAHRFHKSHTAVRIEFMHSLMIDMDKGKLAL